MSSWLALLEINNRDVSIVIWLAVFIIWSISNQSIRKSMLDVLKAMAATPVAISLVALTAYLSLIVYLLHILQVWEISNLKDTILWFFGSAFILFLNVNRAGEDGYLARSIFDNLTLAVLLEFVLNLYVFSIWIELVLVPLLLLLSALIGYASAHREYRDVKKLLTSILVILGLLILVFSIISVAQNLQGFFSIDNLRDFLLPLLLAFALVPYIYSLGLFLLYESVFNRLEAFSRDSRIASYAKWRTFLAFGLHLSSIRSWSRQMGVLDLQSKSDIVEAITEHKRSPT